MTYRIEVGPDGNPSRTVSADDIVDVDIARTHTALSDADVTVPWDTSWKSNALDRIRIYATSDDSLLFRGYIQKFDWDQAGGTTKILAQGIGLDLKDQPIERTYTNTKTYKAIEDIWNNDTGFSATVYQPSTTTVVQDGTVYDLTTNSDFSGQTTLGATDPFVIKNGRLALSQTAYFAEAENVYSDDNNVRTESLSGASGGTVVRLGGNNDQVDVDFTTEHDIPQSNVSVAYRIASRNGNESDEYDVRIDGTDLVSGQWLASGNGDASWFSQEGWSSGDLAAGTHTMTIELVAQRTDDLLVDCLALYDSRYTSASNWDDTTDSNDALDDPPLYPASGQYVQLDQSTQDYNVTEIGIDSEWKDNDVSGDQAVETSADGGSTWTSSANAEDTTDGYSNNVGNTVDIRAKMNAYGSQSVTPKQNIKGQAINSIKVTYDGTDLSIIDDQTFRGSPFDILKKMHDHWGGRFVIDHAATDANGNLTKKVESFETDTQTKTASFVIKNRQPTIDFTSYANRVTVYGELSGGTRPKVTVQDDSEVNTYGVVDDYTIDPELATLDAVRSRARSLLTQLVSNRDQKGRLEVAPTDVLPGYSYDIDWFADGTTEQAPMERIRWTESLDEARGTANFIDDRDITARVIEQGFAIDNVRASI